MSNIEMKRLARRIARVEQAAANQGKPQLAYSSIENGNLKSYEGDDLKMIVGLQDDGGQATTVFNGPTPPTPVGFTVEVDHGKFILHWFGEFDGDALAPSDWSRAEVHASQDPFFVPSRATARGSIVSAAGGEVTIGVLKGPWTVKMVAWSQAGKMSVSSAPVDVEVPGYGDIVLAEIDAAETLIRNAGEVLVTEQDTLNEKLTEVDGSLNDLGQDLQAVEDAQAQLGTDLSDVMLSVDGKNTIKWDPAAPTSATPGKAVGDLWYRTSGNSIIGFWKWSGSAWVAQLLDVTTIPLIDIGAGTFGTLSGARLIAGSVTASSIAVGDFSNLATIDPVRNVNVTRPSTWATVKDGDYIKPAVGTQQQYLMFKDRTNTVPFGAGDSLRVKFTMNSPEAFQVRAYMWGYPQLEDGSNSGLEAANGLIVDITAGVREYTTVIPVPTNFGTTTTLKSWVLGLRDAANTSMRGAGVRDVSVYRMTGQTLIQDGAVSTNKLSANVLEVGNLKAGSAAIREAVVQKLWAEVVVAKMVVADEFIGENAILTGAVTAPKITASEELWAKIANFVNVKAEMMDADVFIGRRFEGVDISASRFTAGFAVEITESYGIRQFGPDGALNVSLPSDGSTAWISADIKAKSLTVAGPMSIEGPGKVASGGVLQLESGVTPPAAPPNVSKYVKRTQFPPLSETENAVGLAFDGTHFWRAVDNAETGGSDRMERVDTSGNLVSSFENTFWVRNGITIIGTEIFALGIEEGSLRDKSKRFIYVYGFDGTFKRKWEYASYGSGTFQPAIGTDGTDVFVTQCWAEGHASWRRYNKTTGVGLGRYDSDFGLKSDIVSADIGSFDYGSPTMVITKAVERGTVEIYNPTTGEHPNWGGWFAGDMEQVRGTAWANGRFHHLTTAGNLVTMSTTKHPNGSVGPETNDWWAVYTWSNGTNETTISAPKQFTWARRGGIKLSPGQMPAGVSSVRVYVARKATEPTRTDYKLVATTVADGSLVVQDLGTPSGNPPASNSFPNSSPGIIRSTLGNLEFRGDGSGRIGPLTFNADGTMSSSAVPAWVPVTTFASGYGPQTWGFAPAYRVWPDGKVEWRGIVAGAGMAAGAADPFAIPVNARPTQFVQFAGASTTGANLKRVEFRPASDPGGAPNMCRVYHGGVSGAWVSLDGIFYYKT